MVDQLTCAQIIEKWDNDELITSVEMGGLGPGYEQMIQILAMEMVRYIVDHQIPQGPSQAADDWWTDPKNIDDLNDRISQHISNLDTKCSWGISGAQFGAAMNIAFMFARLGYQKAIEKAPDDRRILVTKQSPKNPSDFPPTIGC